MSGTELIGIISGIIAIVDASLKIYNAVDDASSLPRSFRNVAARLPVIQNTLETARAAITEEEEEEEEEGYWARESGNERIERRKGKEPTAKSHDALAKVLLSCYNKTATLNGILQAVLPVAGDSPTRRSFKVIRMFANASETDSLMNGILYDIQVLAANYSVKAATREQIKCLISMIKKTEKGEARSTTKLGSSCCGNCIVTLGNPAVYGDCNNQ